MQAESTLEWRAGHSGPSRGHDGCRRAQEAGVPTALVKAEPWSDVHGTAQYGQAAYGASGGLSRSLAFRSLRAGLDATAAAAHYRRSQNRERKSGDGTSQRRRRGSQPALVISYIQPRAFETCASPAVTQKQRTPSSWRRVIICWEGEAYDRGNTAEGLQPQKPHHSTSALPSPSRPCTPSHPIPLIPTPLPSSPSPPPHHGPCYPTSLKPTYP